MPCLCDKNYKPTALPASGVIIPPNVDLSIGPILQQRLTPPRRSAMIACRSAHKDMWCRKRLRTAAPHSACNGSKKAWKVELLTNVTPLPLILETVLKI